MKWTRLRIFGLVGVLALGLGIALMFVTSSNERWYVPAFLAAEETPDPTAHAIQDVLKWPGMKVDVFGCLLERTFNYRDKKFNCSLRNYVANENPCTAGEAYYEGPSFPEGRAPSLHPLLLDVQLAWERGLLQAVTLRFSKKLDESVMHEIIGYRPGEPRANNVKVYVPEGNPPSQMLVLEAFEHLGAGDVDCSAP